MARCVDIVLLWSFCSGSKFSSIYGCSNVMILLGWWKCYGNDLDVELTHLHKSICYYFNWGICPIAVDNTILVFYDSKDSFPVEYFMLWCKESRNTVFPIHFIWELLSAMEIVQCSTQISSGAVLGEVGGCISIAWSFSLFVCLFVFLSKIVTWHNVIIMKHKSHSVNHTGMFVLQCRMEFVQLLETRGLFG